MNDKPLKSAEYCADELDGLVTLAKDGKQYALSVLNSVKNEILELEKALKRHLEG